jgi:hypothetical protein
LPRLTLRRIREWRAGTTSERGAGPQDSGAIPEAPGETSLWRSAISTAFHSAVCRADRRYLVCQAVDYRRPRLFAANGMLDEPAIRTRVPRRCLQAELRRKPVAAGGGAAGFGLMADSHDLNQMTAPSRVAVKKAPEQA